MSKNIKIYKFKKILPFSFALIMLCSFIGCSGQKEETAKSEISETEVAALEETTAETAATEATTDENAENNIEVIAAERNTAFYKKRLDEFNHKYGTKYVLPAIDKEAMEWILSLSPEAFDDFLMALYDGSAYDIELPRIRNDDIPMGGMYGEIDNTECYEDSDTDKAL